MTTVTTHNPVRTDVDASASAGDRAPRQSRTWALAGIGAALAGMGTVVTSSAVNVVYRDEFSHGSIDGVAEALTEKTGVMFAFHTVTALGRRPDDRLRRRAVPPAARRACRTALAPVVALVGLAGTAVVSILGSGLDTEFAMASAADDGIVVDDASAAMYNHWIGTIPWLWTLAGLAGLAIFVAFRRGGAPRWLGLVGLVLGGLTVALGVSPLEYMAGGDRRPVAARHRDRLHRGRQGLPRHPMNRPARHAGRPGPRWTGPAWSRPAQCPGAAAADRPTLGDPGPPGRLRGPAGRSRSGWTSAHPRRDPASSWPTASAGPTPRSGWSSGCAARVVLLHDPRQGFGWALGGIAIFWGLDGLSQSYVRYGISADDALPGVNAALWFLNRFGAFLPDDRGGAAGHLPDRPVPRGRCGGGSRRSALLAMTVSGLLVVLAPVNGRADDVVLPPGVDLDAGSVPMSAAFVDVAIPVVGRGDRVRPPRHDGRRRRPLPPGQRARAGPDALARVVGRRDGGRRRPVDVLRR